MKIFHPLCQSTNLILKFWSLPLTIPFSLYLVCSKKVSSFGKSIFSSCQAVRTSSSGSKYISDAAMVRATTVPSAFPPDLGRSAAHFLTSKPSLSSHLTLLLILIAWQVVWRATGRAEARRRLGVLRCRRSERGPRRAPH